MVLGILYFNWIELMIKRIFYELYNMVYDLCFCVFIYSLKIKDEVCNKLVIYIIDINFKICLWYYGKMYVDIRFWKLLVIELKNNILFIILI